MSEALRRLGEWLGGLGAGVWLAVGVFLLIIVRLIVGASRTGRAERETREEIDHGDSLEMDEEEAGDG